MNNLIVRLLHTQYQSIIKLRHFHDKIHFVYPNNKDGYDVAKTLPQDIFAFIDKTKLPVAFRFSNTIPNEQIVGDKKYPTPYVLDNGNEYMTAGLVLLTKDPHTILQRMTQEDYKWLKDSYCLKIDLTKLGDVVAIPNDKKKNSSELITLQVPPNAIISYQECQDGKLIGKEKKFEVQEQSNCYRKP